MFIYIPSIYWSYLITHNRKKTVRTAYSKHERNTDVYKAKSSNLKQCKYSCFFQFQ